ncbi:hypothetical protein ACF07D_10515 [Leucobacter sp. NPDC015123]|uniref:hypothetical protein n=1 Tax=Leucobacter sp. NPDC015123 TaxID=3364129 RepID=UPI0036F480C7
MSTDRLQDAEVMEALGVLSGTDLPWSITLLLDDLYKRVASLEQQTELLQEQHPSVAVARTNSR